MTRIPLTDTAFIEPNPFAKLLDPDHRCALKYFTERHHESSQRSKEHTHKIACSDKRWALRRMEEMK